MVGPDAITIIEPRPHCDSINEAYERAAERAFEAVMLMEKSNVSYSKLQKAAIVATSVRALKQERTKHCT